MPRAPRTPPSITEQIARAADRDGPGFDTTVLALTLNMIRAATGPSYALTPQNFCRMGSTAGSRTS